MADENLDSIHSKIRRVLAIVALSCAFSLVLWFGFHLLILNPLIAVFGIMACGVYWLIVEVDARGKR